MSFFKKIKKFTGTAVGAAAAPFTGGLSLVAGAAYDYMNYQKRAQEKQNKANQAAIDRANAYDMYTWDLANQYNNPKAQMERLKAAGLNPNLVYGSGSVVGNTTGPASSNGVADVGVYNAANDIISKGLPLAQGFANLRNTNAQNKLLEYQMGQTAAQTAQVQAETRNLNNFLDGSGKSTYDPVLSKNAGAAGDILSGLYEGSKNAVAGFVGKHAAAIDRGVNSVRNNFSLTGAWNNAKSIYNTARSWFK